MKLEEINKLKPAFFHRNKVEFDSFEVRNCAFEPLIIRNTNENSPFRYYAEFQSDEQAEKEFTNWWKLVKAWHKMEVNSIYGVPNIKYYGNKNP